MDKNAKILVTGATGFLGQHLCRALVDYYGFTSVIAVGRRGQPIQVKKTNSLMQSKWGYDLTNTNDVQNLFYRDFGTIDYVFHLAGYNGGIQFNIDYPASIFFRNTVMGLNVAHYASLVGVKKVLFVVASCAYPAQDDLLQPDSFLTGQPHDTVSCHGYAKRNLQLISKFISLQHHMETITACPQTIYGPGDSFRIEKTKVMAALIKKLTDAKDSNADSVQMWGTGVASREFLFVEDAAKLLVEAMVKYRNPKQPLNLTPGEEITVLALVNKLAAILEYKGAIEWDSTKPDGQLRKRLEVTQETKEVMSHVNLTSLDDGIKRTIEYYRSYRDSQAN